MKFGEVLNSIKQGFDKMSTGPKGGVGREDKNFDIHKTLRNNLADLVNQAQKTAEEIEKIENLKFQAEAAGRRNLALIYKGQLDKEINSAKKIEEERKRIEKDFENVEKEIIENRIKGNQKLKKSYGDLSNIEEDYTNKLKTLIEARSRGFISEEKYRKMAGNLDYLRRSKQVLMATTASSTDMADSFIKLLGTGLGTLLSKILPGFGLIIDGVVALFKIAWKQMIEENDALINIMRSTGGVINARALGYNTSGGSLNGFSSFETDAIKANVTMDQMGKQLSSLFEGPMGQIVGMKTNLKDSAGEMQNYALTAAKMSKLWGVEIAGTVANLTMDYGMSVGGATSATEAFMYSAKDLGLNMKFAGKNLEKVSAAANKYYFRSFDQMTKLAMLATNLGVDVDGLLDGSSKINQMTDLFSKQQEASAYEMQNYANNMSRIYAMHMNGNEAEAAKLKLSAAYADLDARGMYDRRGQIAPSGMTTLKQMGFNQEEIDALNRLGKLEKLGVSKEAALDPTLATKMEIQKIRGYELENKTISENLFMAFKAITQPIVNFVKNLMGPPLMTLIKLLFSLGDFIGFVMEFVGILVNVAKPVMMFAVGIWEGIAEAMAEFSGWLQDTLAPLKDFFSKFDKVGEVLFEIGKVLGKLFFKILFGAVYIVVYALTKFFESLYMVYKAVVSFFKPAVMFLWEGIKKVINFFSPVINLFKTIFGWLADILKKFGSWLGISGDAASQFTDDLTKSDKKVINNKALDDKIWSEIYKNDIEAKVATKNKEAIKTVLAPISTKNDAQATKNAFANAFDLTKQKGYQQPVILNNTVKVNGVFSETGRQSIKTQ